MNFDCWEVILYDEWPLGLDAGALAAGVTGGFSMLLQDDG